MQGRPVRTDLREGGSLDHACGTDSPDGRMPTAGDCGIRVGYSTVTQTPEFKRALKRSNGRFTLGLLLGCVGLPILVGIIMAIIMGDGLYGAVSLLVLPITVTVMVIFLVRRNAAKPWDGKVLELRHTRGGDGPDRYVIVCRTDEGRVVRVRDHGGHPLYDYLEVGDRVRFHPRLNVALEKHDKTSDEYLPCPFCGRKNPLDAHECVKCARPLLR